MPRSRDVFTSSDWVIRDIPPPTVEVGGVGVVAEYIEGLLGEVGGVGSIRLPSDLEESDRIGR